MELLQLKIFEAVSRHLNITHAAAELCMSQSAVSLQLKRLERQCKAPLYLRKNDGVSLTSRGCAFLDAVGPILAQIDRIEFEFKGREERRDIQPFSVGSSNALSSNVLPELLLEFKRRNPEVPLLVEAQRSRSMEKLVFKRQVDLAIVTRPTQSPGLACEPYIEYEAVAFAPIGHHLCGKTLSLAELAEVPLVLRRGSGEVRELQKRGYELNVFAEFSTTEAVKTAVKGGMGVGIMFRSYLDADLANGEICALDVPRLRALILKSYIVFAKRQRLPIKLQSFLQILRAHQSFEAALRSNH